MLTWLNHIKVYYSTNNQPTNQTNKQYQKYIQETGNNTLRLKLKEETNENLVSL